MIKLIKDGRGYHWAIWKHSKATRSWSTAKCNQRQEHPKPVMVLWLKKINFWILVGLSWPSSVQHGKWTKSSLYPPLSSNMVRWCSLEIPHKRVRKNMFLLAINLRWVRGFPSHVWWHRSLALHCYSKPDPHRGKNKSGYPKKCGENILKLHGSRWLCPQNPSSVSVIAFYRCC